MIVTPTNIHKSLALACWRSPKEAKTQIEIIECTSTSIKLYMVFQVPSHTLSYLRYVKISQKFVSQIILHVKTDAW